MKTRTGLALSVLAGLFLVGRAVADGIPTVQPLTYSGVLQSSTGVAISTQQSMQLSLWDDATANASANQRCVTPTQNVTPDSQGRFSIVLDQACFAAVKANPNLWVQVQVGATVLPRSKLGAVPYAVEAGRAARTIVTHMNRSTTLNGLYCGATAQTTGAVTASGGALTGYRAGKLLCEQTCGSATAHHCSPSEVVVSHTLGLNTVDGWVSASQSASFETYRSRDCDGFLVGTQAAAGTIWFATSSRVDTNNCGQALPLLCCD